MRLEYLTYFTHVVHCGSIRLASTELFISPQGISQAIQSLEKELNVRLFDRNNHSLSLTPSGQLLYDTAVTILQLIENLEDHLQTIHIQDDSLNQKLITVYSCTHIGSTFLAQIINDFSTKNPNTKIRILETSPNDLIDLLHTNIDMENTIMLYAIPESELDELNQQLPSDTEFLPLATSPIMALVSARSSLSKADCITEKELSSHPLVIYSNGDVFLDILGIPYNPDNIILKSQNISFCRTFVSKNPSVIHFTDQISETFFSKEKRSSLAVLPVTPETNLVYGIIKSIKYEYGPSKVSKLLNIITNKFNSF